MGGLVTWAKRCLRKWWTSRGRLATAANGVSSPIENVGSLASVAIGLRTMATSSLSTPKATWVRTTSASSASSACGVPIGKRAGRRRPTESTAPGGPATV